MANDSSKNVVIAKQLEALANAINSCVDNRLDSYMRKTPATIAIDCESITFGTIEATETITVTTNSDGEIFAVPADPLVCSASVNGNSVTIKPESVHGETTLKIYVATSWNFAKSEVLSVPVLISADSPVNMLTNRSLSDVQSIFQNGQGATYFKAGDFFDITMPTTITLQCQINEEYTTIPEGSTWRCVLLGIDHNSALEGTNRGHFAICKNTNNVQIAFQGMTINNSNTNAGGWNGSALKSWLNTTFYNSLPTDLINVIIESTKYTDNVAGNSTRTAENVTASTQYIWIPAEFEITGQHQFANPYEQNKQQQYDYYKNGNDEIFNTHHTPTERGDCWLRSPQSTTLSNFIVCMRPTHTYAAKASVGSSGKSAAVKTFVPCFCIG